MPLFNPQELEKRYQTPTGETAFRWQSLALEAFTGLKDKTQYKPQYLALFKKADKYCIDLMELVDKSRGKDNPGSYFLTSARIALGISKRKEKML